MSTRVRYYPSHLKRFHGLPVHRFAGPDEEPGPGRRPPPPASVAWRLTAD